MRIPVLCVSLAACSATPDAEPDLAAERQLPAAVKDDATAIARANNQFACDLYAHIATGGDNTFFSPFSISTALAMTDAGAAGATDLELRAALHFTLPGERTHAAVGAILASLDRGSSHGLYTLATANGLFGQIGFPLEPAFTAILNQDYGAESTQVDFQAAPEAARATVNNWVASKTDHKIPELFGSGSITSDDRLVLANAVVFKGTWAHKFKPADTTTSSFQLATGETIQVPMMTKSDTIATTPIQGGTLGVLPFGGQDLSFVVVVPNAPDGLPAIEAQLSGDAIAAWMAAAASHAPEDRGIQLPRFSLAVAPELQPALASLGITTAFDPVLADFSGIDGRRDLFLEHVLHKALIDVNEDGAEAAAASGVGVGTTAVPAPLVMDRPFVFFLYDHVTGAVLFMGRLSDPRA